MEVYKSATVLLLLAYGSFILNVTLGFPLQIDSDKELKILKSSSPSEIEAEMSQSVFNPDDVNSKEMSNEERIAKFEHNGWTKTTLQDYEDNFENEVLALTQQKDKKKADFSDEEIIKLESTPERMEAELALMENIPKALELNKQSELAKEIEFENAFEVEENFQKEVDERLVKKITILNTRMTPNIHLKKSIQMLLNLHST